MIVVIVVIAVYLWVAPTVGASALRIEQVGQFIFQDVSTTSNSTEHEMSYLANQPIQENHLTRSKRSAHSFKVLKGKYEDGLHVMVTGHINTFNYMLAKDAPCPLAPHHNRDIHRDITFVSFCRTKLVLTDVAVNRTHVSASLEAGCSSRTSCSGCTGCTLFRMGYNDLSSGKIWRTGCACITNHGGPTAPP